MAFYAYDEQRAKSFFAADAEKFLKRRGAVTLIEDSKLRLIGLGCRCPACGVAKFLNVSPRQRKRYAGQCATVRVDRGGISVEGFIEFRCGFTGLLQHGRWFVAPT